MSGAHPAACAPEIALCDHAGCGKPAKFAYTWEWGETGKCCETHQFTLNQTAGNLARTITFQPLVPDGPPPLLRDERTQLLARAISAESEVDDVKARALELYNQNVRLTQQLQSLTVQHREVTEQLSDARAEVEKCAVELVQRRSENGDLHDELSRLRCLVPLKLPELDDPPWMAPPPPAEASDDTAPDTKPPPLPPPHRRGGRPTRHG